MDFDMIFINELNLAVYLFKDAVSFYAAILKCIHSPQYDLQLSEVLKRHHILPHWMFAMDSIIRAAVQCAINILQPGKILFLLSCVQLV